MTDRMKKLYRTRTSCWFLTAAGACICFALITLIACLISVAYKLNIIFQNSATIVTTAPTTYLTAEFTCQQNQYYDNVRKMCVSQKLINETCNTAMECRSDLGIECSNNSVCQCTPSLPLWDPSNNKCAACNSTGNYSCQCPALQYLNTTQNKCVNQSTNGETCSLDIECRIDLGLSCQSGLCRCNSTYQYWSTIVFKCLNYQIYTESCTSSGGECDTRLKLLCNTGTTCDCPSTSQVNKCDCVRVSGNESYWNGTSCTVALTNGTSCQNASTSYMCQTLTQGTVCNTTGTSYYCQCPSLQYFNTTQSKCLSKQTNLGTCSLDIECRIDLGLSCQSGVCKCNSTYQYWSTSLFKCNSYQTYTDACTSSGGECDLRLKLLCNAGTTCDCPSTSQVNKCDCVRVSGNESYWNGASCTAAHTNGTSCQNASTSYMCQTLTQGTVCNTTGSSYYCQCPSLQYFNTTQGKCLPQQTDLGICSVNIECRIDLGLSCVSSVCQCNSTYQFWSTTLLKCVNYKTYAEACSPDFCDPRASLICNTGTACNCPTSLGKGFCDCIRVSGNENYWNGTSCVLAAAYGGKCMAGKTYQCQTFVISGVICDSYGVCQCNNVTGGLQSFKSKCVVCDTNWGFINPSCYYIGTYQVVQANNQTEIDTSCGRSASLAELTTSTIKSYFQSHAAGRLMWVNLKENGGTTYSSPTGSWNLQTTGSPTWCSNNLKSIKGDCVYYDGGSDCYDDTSCSGKVGFYPTCEYTP